MKKQILYGMLGFLSLLGFAGVFTEARGFLGFFAFAVDFQYFFLKSDEMLEAQLARSASRAFVVGMLMMAAAVLGTLTLDREMSMFTGTCRWMGKEVQISLDVEIEKKASWTRATNVMKKLLADQEVWDKSLRAMAAQKLTAQANEWLADNDQTDRDPEKDPITGDEFARRIILTEFSVSPGGRFTAWYEDDDMFWGHVVTVDGTLKKGPIGADIQG